MNTKCLITASIFALISASTAQAADVRVSHHLEPVAPSTVVVPNFTWTGFYFGGQVSGFSSKVDMDFISKDKTVPLSKDLLPSLSGLAGGLYTGFNIDLSDSFVLGIDTDFIWADKKNTKTIFTGDFVSGNALAENVVGRARRSAAPAAPAAPAAAQAAPAAAPAAPAAAPAASVKAPVLQAYGKSHGATQGHSYAHGASNREGHSSYHHNAQSVSGSNAQNIHNVDKKSNSVYGIEQVMDMASALGFDNDKFRIFNHTLKQNWVGTTRIRIGFAADRIMPYVAGGVAYTQLQDAISISSSSNKSEMEKVSSKDVVDETKMMVGYTLGGGVDFAVLDNVIVRAEYRYSDFGKKKFAKEKLEVRYKTNDVRVGVAYKF
ncbi:outer membrane protein [Bartonella sp. B35(2025)]